MNPIKIKGYANLETVDVIRNIVSKPGKKYFSPLMFTFGFTLVPDVSIFTIGTPKFPKLDGSPIFCLFLAHATHISIF